MIELLKNKLIIFKIFFLIFILSNCTNTKSNNKVSQSSDIKLYSKGLASLKKGNFSAAIKAEELRLKVTGLMVARSHVTHEHVDNLSREQIVEQLQEFMNRAKNRISQRQNQITCR